MPNTAFSAAAHTPPWGFSLVMSEFEAHPEGETGMGWTQKELQGTEASRPLSKGKRLGHQRERGRRGKGNPSAAPLFSLCHGEEESGFSPPVAKALSSCPSSAPAEMPIVGHPHHQSLVC